MAAVPSDIDAEDTVARWAKGLQQHLCRKLACPHDAEDIAQEACIKLLLERKKDKEIRNPRAYLFRIAHNLLYRHYASEQQRPSRSDVDTDTLTAGGVSIDEHALTAIRREQVNRAANELSPKCRRVLRLRWSEGLRVAEIAGEMNLSQAMVKKYLATGLAHCRKRLRTFIETDRTG
ncbi:MAG: RNA polymerase sigma factor [Pseudomonadota bacterium]